MHRRGFLLAGTAAGVLMLAANKLSFAQDAEASAPDLARFPRNETLIIQNPEQPAQNPGWFNLWVLGGGNGTSTGLHQLTMDTFWFIDPDAGLDGANYNSLASAPPQYNDDFTQLTVSLREGVYWSDGVEFTSDDVKYTVDTQMSDPIWAWGARFSSAIESVEAPDKYTVVFNLKSPNARFHSLFSVRWNGAWIMPKHVFEAQTDPKTYNFNPPVSLGPYVLNSFDPNGAWYAWEKREDWDRTAMAEWGEPGPKFVIYRSIPNIDNRLIEMVNGNLDMIHDLSPEAMFSLARQSETSRGWFPGFPYAHPDPTLPMVIFNTQNPKFEDKRVRWALTLLLDPVQMSMASYRGAATLSAIAMPPTGTHTDDYFAPMQQWLTDYQIDLGNGSSVQPYDPTVGQRIADTVRPQFGDSVPTEQEAINKSFGYGWWKKDPEAAAALLEAAGFTRSGNSWTMPDGQPFAFTIKTFPEGVINRLATDIAQQWTQAGVNVTAEVAPRLFEDDLPLGTFEAATAWSIETWGGNPDLSFFLDSWHSEFVVPAGSDQRQPARNWQRWSDPRLDDIIERVRVTDFNDTEANIELGKEFIQLMVDEMPIIPIMSFNVFSAYDTRVWTGFPTAEENPYANIVNNWANSRYILTQLKPAAS